MIRIHHYLIFLCLESLGSGNTIVRHNALTPKPPSGEDKLIKTVLIVDDNDLLLEILYEVLSWEGFEVLQASNGRAALELVNSRKVDLVISDIQMPNGDGVELMKQIHSLDGIHRPGLILVSGNIASLKFNPDDYNVLAVSQKPIDYDYLIRTIHNHPYQGFQRTPSEFILTTG